MESGEFPGFACFFVNGRKCQLTFAVKIAPIGPISEQAAFLTGRDATRPLPPIMKPLLISFAAVLFALPALAQEDDSLTATLPSGKVVHFETEEQKAKFLAARERMAMTPPAPAVASATPGASPKGATHLTPEATPQMNGKVNVNAPTFTADYYLFAPETWDGKQVTVSVAYLQRENATRSDGLVAFTAVTYGTLQMSGEQHFGGEMTVLATTEAASRISSLAGTRYQYNGWGTKTVLFKGTFKKSQGGKKGYYLYVDK